MFEAELAFGGIEIDAFASLYLGGAAAEGCDCFCVIAWRFGGFALVLGVGSFVHRVRAAHFSSGRAKATIWPPEGRLDLPPPAEITTYCLPSML